MTPSSSRAAVSTISRTEAMPARWPSTRGRLRARAQRPFPSMITATCLGSRLRSIFSTRVSSSDPGSASLLKSIIALPMLVRDLPKHQAFRGCGPARFPERRFERCDQRARLDLAAADLNQRPGDPPDHVAQEAVRADADLHDVRMRLVREDVGDRIVPDAIDVRLGFRFEPAVKIVRDALE